MNFMPFGQLKSFLKILIGVQYEINNPLFRYTLAASSMRLCHISKDRLKKSSQSTFVLRQHRTIWQEDSARIFAPIQSLKNGGILYVFPIFRAEEVGQKDGWGSQAQLCGVALNAFSSAGCIPAEQCLMEKRITSGWTNPALKSTPLVTVFRSVPRSTAM